jgi:hypothetical protein
MAIVKYEDEEDQQAFLPKDGDDALFSQDGSWKATTSSALKRYRLRLVLEVLMASAIVVLLFVRFPSNKTETAVKPSPVPICMFLRHISDLIKK